MNVEDKLIELAQLAEELKAQDTTPLDEKKTDKEDEPKGSDISEIIPDDEDDDEDEDDVKEPAKKTDKVDESISTLEIGALFEGQDLSEEFKSAATELFEAVVKQRIGAATAALEENFEQRVATATVELKESLVDKVDGYLDFIVEQWMNKNELAINRGIKTEILESFVSGMKEVFESHYIDVPDEKYDLVEAAQSEVTALETRLDEEVAKSIELTKTLKDINRQIMIDEAAEGLVETDAEKFRQLAEELSYVEDGFDKKLSLIKESYFSKSKKEIKAVVEEFMTDSPVAVIEENVNQISPVMQQYLTAIERSAY